MAKLGMQKLIQQANLRISTPAEEMRNMLLPMSEALFPPNDIWYAYSSAGGNDNGKSWENACPTIAAAVAKSSNRDVIKIKGWFAENVDMTTYGSDPWYLTIEGVDEAWDMNQWGASGAGPCIDCSVPSLTLKNIRFLPPASGIALRLNMNASLQGAGRSRIVNCRFDNYGGKYAIVAVGAPPSVIIEDCVFEGLTASGAYAIYNTSSPTAAPRAWIIRRNLFFGNVNHISMAANNCQFLNNTLQGQGHAITTTKKLWLTGAVNDNVIHGNMLGGTDWSIVGGYQGGSGDNWLGNMTGEVGSVGAGGTDTTGATEAVVPPAS